MPHLPSRPVSRQLLRTHLSCAYKCVVRRCAKFPTSKVSPSSTQTPPLMAKFSDLPVETIREIITWSLELWRHPYDRRSQLKVLMLVCRHLGNITRPIAFRKYTLRLRDAPRGLVDHDVLRVFTMSLLDLDIWDSRLIHARLAHLRECSSYVRELRIIDWGKPVGEDDFGPDSFDSSIMPMLLGTLNYLSGITRVSFETARGPSFNCTPFPIELWHWLSHIKPKEVIFNGHFSFPKDIGPLPSVKSLTVRLHTDSRGVVNVSFMPDDERCTHHASRLYNPNILSSTSNHRTQSSLSSSMYSRLIHP
ncbi:hypothetical protein BC834DRAFT_303868 [Gloeopeniophorella convolvens]|nr:hypothetical protein BC834DRAFT_303868 [Gloeopeniophorella convolvens]